MSQPVGYHCPGCGRAPVYALDEGRQCVCGNDECHVFMWNAELSVEQLADNSRWFDPPNLGPA